MSAWDERLRIGGVPVPESAAVTGPSIGIHFQHAGTLAYQSGREGEGESAAGPENSTNPQLPCATWKSPLAVSALMFKSAAPLLESVMVWAGLAVPVAWVTNTMLDGVNAGMGAAPLPVNGIANKPWLVLMVSVPARGPAAVGTNATFTKQAIPVESWPEQLLN